ncbi:hemolysin family protein [Paenibacillus sp. GYB004]|uniref:hemolysin family protein n=1 Tax=Paenibacillus sp. GYB004 TaxID=2994393 RepID=UPI002F96DBF4
MGNRLESGPLPIGWSMALIVALVMLNGFFVAAQFAMVKIRGTRIESLVQEGRRRAKFAQAILGDLNLYLSVCQFGITLTSLGLGWIGGPALAKLLERPLSALPLSGAAVQVIGFLTAFMLIAALHITIGVQVPKTVAMHKPERTTLWSAYPMLAFYKLMLPIMGLLNGLSDRLLQISGIQPERGNDSVHSEEEIRILVKESHKNGLIDNTELTLVEHIFEFSDTNAREIMIPRTEMVCLYTNLSYEENKKIAINEMHTRYPVAEINKDNIIGFVHIKELLKHNDSLDNIMTIIRPLMNVPESMPISTLLRLLQKNRTEMALLIDEYGGTSGLVTVEDIMEEIVGEIRNEFDEERPRIEEKAALTYSIDGLLLIDDVNQYFGTGIETDNYDTIGGWIYSQVEIPPCKSQRVDRDGLEFIVEEVDHMRISRLTVRVPEHYKMPLRQEVS